MFLNRILSANAFILSGMLFHFIFSFDLKSGYHHVISCIADFCYFHWILVPLKLDMFTLLFALWDSAPYNFTKLLKPTETHWRIRGIPIAIIFDDGIGVDSTLEAAKTNSSSVHSDLFRCGFGINHEKSVWQPSTTFS